ncbi:addiction module toxin RelE [Alsobacter soli]|uniref:Addiction module toxin RelE n=1 Tax=Alsobacter soli TaxID=2109933 RepID=A0A2T1HNM3_9HYPH|nr:type II toxin-antitoxin system RelE/ParE family toxin [Alsobacter soli]PSC03233.1 addiction module toxin RelE [Alsobacter soli]
MRIYKNKWFQRFARREKIGDAELCEAVDRAAQGLIDADLGGGLIKQRVARPGAGKSGGYRTLLFFRAAERAVFAFGFAKSDRDNIDHDDAADLRKAAKLVLGFTQDQIDRLVKAGTLIEVRRDEQG